MNIQNVMEKMIVVIIQTRILRCVVSTSWSIVLYLSFSSLSSSIPAQHSCSLLQTRCEKDPVCIPTYKVCDGDNDCPDKSDESRCIKERTCKETDFKCLDGSTCVPRAARCDQRRDCPDGSDEAKCSKISFHSLTAVATARPKCVINK